MCLIVARRIKLFGDLFSLRESFSMIGLRVMGNLGRYGSIHPGSAMRNLLLVKMIQADAQHLGHHRKHSRIWPASSGFPVHQRLRRNPMSVGSALKCQVQLSEMQLLASGFESLGIEFFQFIHGLSSSCLVCKRHNKKNPAVFQS